MVRVSSNSSIMIVMRVAVVWVVHVCQPDFYIRHVVESGTEIRDGDTLYITTPRYQNHHNTTTTMPKTATNLKKPYPLEGLSKDFPQVYQHLEDKLPNKKTLLSTLYDAVRDNKIEQTLKCGATYDILDYNEMEDYFLVSYLPDTDSDEDEYGKPEYLKLAYTKSLRRFLTTNIIDIATTEDNSIKMSLERLIKNKYLRVLWNGEINEFVLSNIFDMLDVTTYEQNINHQ